MRKVRMFAALLLVVALLATSAFAAEFVPSVEQKGAPEYLGSSVDTDDAHIIITPYADAKGDILAELDDAKSDLAKMKDGYIVTDLYDASMSDGSKLTGPVTLTFKGTPALIALHKMDGTWEEITPKDNGDGTFSITTNGLSPIAFLQKADNSGVKPAEPTKPADTTKPAASGTKTVTSPQTGEENVLTWLLSLLK